MILFFSIVISILVAICYTEKLMEFYYLGILGILTILKDTGKEEKLFRPMFSFSIFGLIIGCMKYKELFSIIKDGSFYIIDKISMFF
jgi:hypothetical protein